MCKHTFLYFYCPSFPFQLQKCKSKILGSISFVFASVFDVNIIVCIFVIEMEMIDLKKIRFYIFIVYHFHFNYTHVKVKFWAAFPLVFAYVFDVNIILCIFVIEMEMIDM